MQCIGLGGHYVAMLGQTRSIGFYSYSHHYFFKYELVKFFLYSAFEIACKDEAMKYMQDFQDMSMFLGTHNHSRSALKEALQEISGYEEVLCDIYDVALKIVDTPAYIKHQDKHSLLKVYTNLW